MAFVSFAGRKERQSSITFHRLWDETLIQERVYDWGALVAALEADEVPTLAAASITSGSFADWATDCHAAGVAAYAALPAGAPERNDPQHPVMLTAAYADATLAIVRAQLAKGGLRLASVLNDALEHAGHHR